MKIRYFFQLNIMLSELIDKNDYDQMLGVENITKKAVKE
jgi:hypothetical protein